MMGGRQVVENFPKHQSGDLSDRESETELPKTVQNTARKAQRTIGEGYRQENCGVGRSDPGLAEVAPPNLSFALPLANWVTPAHALDS
jgi:hypothetical protein